MRRKVQRTTHLKRFIHIAAGLFFATALHGVAATGTIRDVQHVVVLMMENRSFDHFMGSMGGVRGYNDRNALQLPSGQSDFYQPYGGSYVLPFPVQNQDISDVPHDNGTGLADWDNGKWDYWVPAKTSETMCYFPPSYLPLHSALVQTYTTCDDYFCSLIGPTYPNRLYLFTGTIDPTGANGGPAIANEIPAGGFTWTTYPELLQNAGVNWRVYRPVGDFFGDVLPWFAQFMRATPGTPLYDRGVAEVPDVISSLRSDVINGTLPQVSWVIPTILQSGHPPYSPNDAENFIGNVIGALSANPAVYASTVLFITYDENGGFFDHVPSPIAPPGTPLEYVNGQPLGLGVRVPMLIVSPWTRGGKVCSQVFDHTSVLRFLETWTGVMETNISPWRRQLCGDLTSAFNFAAPNTNLPNLPVIAAYDPPTVTPVPPTNQALPTQQTNILWSVPLPYNPEITAQTDCGSHQLHLTMTNAGAALAHFIIYGNPVQNNGPQQCDVGPGSSLTVSFYPAGGSRQPYDYTCYGPNGFERRFAGSISQDCGSIEAISMIDTNAGTISIAEENAAGAAVQFVLTDNYGLDGPWTNTVPPNSTNTTLFEALANNNAWYDYTVTASSDTTFVRHFTGHIETGQITASEPIQPPYVPPPVNPAPALPETPVVLTNSPGVTGLLASVPRIPSVTSLPCYSTTFNTNMVLIYPGWASNYTVMASASLAPGSWVPVKITMTNMGNYSIATFPMSTNAMFFRLRQ